MVARVAKFTDTMSCRLRWSLRPPTTKYLEPAKAMKIRRLNDYYSHPSVNKMKRMRPKDLWSSKLHLLEISRFGTRERATLLVEGACKDGNRGEARGERCL